MKTQIPLEIPKPGDFAMLGVVVTYFCYRIFWQFISMWGSVCSSGCQRREGGQMVKTGVMEKT